MFSIKSKEVHFSNEQNSRSEDLWHQCLGHPQQSVVRLLRTKNLILVSSEKKWTLFVKVSNQKNLANYHLVHLLLLVMVLLKKFIVIFVNQPLILSLGKFRYYAYFVDDYSHYQIIHLRAKSDFLDVYLVFESYVQRQFDKRIKVFHSDDDKFVNQKLSSYFQQQGIVHQLSCPRTHEQTSIIERRHRTIRELGMAIIFHSEVPNCQWVEVFSTTFLIHRLPSSFIQLLSRKY